MTEDRLVMNKIDRITLSSDLLEVFDFDPQYIY